MSLENFYSWFRDWDDIDYVFLGQRQVEPTEADIASVESQIGFRLPEDFREFSMDSLGGSYLAVREELWPRPKANHVAPLWTFFYGLTVYSFCKEAPDWMLLTRAWDAISKKGHSNLVPFLRIIGNADRYCFNRNQQIVIWRHDTPERSEVISESFYEVLLREIEALEDRKIRWLRGEGHLDPTKHGGHEPTRHSEP